MLLIDEIVERSVKDTDDLGTLVVDNRLGLCVPDDRNGKSSIVVWIGLEVEVSQAFDVVQRFLGSRPLRDSAFRLAVTFVVLACRRSQRQELCSVLQVTLPEKVHPLVLMCGCTTDTAMPSMMVSTSFACFS